jgi:fructose transport system ATP-binding protein
MTGALQMAADGALLESTTQHMPEEKPTSPHPSESAE